MFLAPAACFHGTATRDLEKMGGALRRCPRTGTLAHARASRSQGCRRSRVRERVVGVSGLIDGGLAPGSSAGQVLLLLFAIGALAAVGGARRAVLRADRGNRAARAGPHPRRPSMRRVERRHDHSDGSARGGRRRDAVRRAVRRRSVRSGDRPDRACLGVGRGGRPGARSDLVAVPPRCAHARSGLRVMRRFAARPARTAPGAVAMQHRRRACSTPAARSATRWHCCCRARCVPALDPGEQGVSTRRGRAGIDSRGSVHAVRVRALLERSASGSRSCAGSSRRHPPLRALHRRDGVTALAIVTVYDWWVGPVNEWLVVAGSRCWRSAVFSGWCGGPRPPASGCAAW